MKEKKYQKTIIDQCNFESTMPESEQIEAVKTGQTEGDKHFKYSNFIRKLEIQL